MAGGSTVNTLGSNVNVIVNIAQSLLPVERLITGFAYVMGIFFAFKAVYSLKVYGESRTMMSSHTSLKEPLTYLFVAGIFIYFPTGLAVILNTAFGSSNILQYDSQNSGLFSDSAIWRSIILVIQVIGLIAFVRGWYLIARSSSQGQSPGGVGKGMVHILGGILAMNIVLTLEIINNTLYGTS